MLFALLADVMTMILVEGLVDAVCLADVMTMILVEGLVDACLLM